VPLRGQGTIVLAEEQSPLFNRTSLLDYEKRFEESKLNKETREFKITQLIKRDRKQKE